MDAAGVGGHLPAQLVTDHLAAGDDVASRGGRHGAGHTVYALFFGFGKFGVRRRGAQSKRPC